MRLYKIDAVNVKMNSEHLDRLRNRLIEKLEETIGVVTLAIRNIENQKGTKTIFSSEPEKITDQLTTVRKSMEKTIKILR